MQKRLTKVRTGLWNKGPLKVLNGAKLILDDHGNTLDSFRINLESFRSFKGPLIHKPVTAVSYSKLALVAILENFWPFFEKYLWRLICPILPQKCSSSFHELIGNIWKWRRHGKVDFHISRKPEPISGSSLPSFWVGKLFWTKSSSHEYLQLLCRLLAIVPFEWQHLKRTR